MYIINNLKNYFKNLFFGKIENKIEVEATQLGTETEIQQEWIRIRVVPYCDVYWRLEYKLRNSDWQIVKWALYTSYNGKFEPEIIDYGFSNLEKAKDFGLRMKSKANFEEHLSSVQRRYEQAKKDRIEYLAARKITEL